MMITVGFPITDSFTSIRIERSNHESVANSRAWIDLKIFAPRFSCLIKRVSQPFRADSGHVDAYPACLK